MSLVEVKIGDLGKVITGNTPPKKDPNNYDGTYPFIKPTDMVIDKRYVTEWDENYSEKAYKQYHRSYIPPGATGVVTIGTVGEKLFQAHQHCFTNQSVNVIIPNDKYCDDYVFYLMKLNLPKVESANPGTASGRHHVSKSNFCSIKVDVIESIDSQKRIADILSAYDDLIENNLKRIKLLEQAAQNIYKEWFVNLRFPGNENTPINEETGLPKGWVDSKYSNHFDLLTGRKDANHSTLDGDYPFFTCGKEIIKSPDFSFDCNAILLAGNGDFNVKYFRGKFQAYQRTYILSPFNSKEFFLLFIHLSLNLKYLTHGSKGSVIKYLTKGMIEDFTFILPNETILEKFNNLCENIFSQIETLEKQSQKLKAARDILLPRLMNRTIEV